jgi:transcriptional regulator with XRE-family HTH domain
MIKPSDKKILRKLGSHIKRLREQKNLSLREMSYACNVDNSKISKIEKGAVNITFTTIVQLAAALEVKPNALLDFDFE